MSHDGHRGLLTAHRVAEVHDDLVRHGDELVRHFLDGLASGHPRIRLRNHGLRESEEARLYVLSGLRGTQESGHAEALLEIVQRLLRFPSGIREVHLVADDDDRNRVRHLEQVRNPVVLKTLRRLRSRDVVHQKGSLSPLKRTLLNPLVALLSEDVPNHEGQVREFSRRLDPQVLFRDLRPDRGDVLVRELVHHEASDQARFPDRPVAEEEDLAFDVVVDHRGAAPCRGHAYNACWLNVIRANTGVPLEEKIAECTVRVRPARSVLAITGSPCQEEVIDSRTRRGGSVCHAGPFDRKAERNRRLAK